MIKVVSLVIGSLKSNDLPITITTYHLVHAYAHSHARANKAYAHAHA